MDNERDMKALIDAFKGYRELLSPIQQSLHELVDTYDNMKSDLARLDAAFDGTMNNRLDQIYETLSQQARRSTDLSSRIDQFVRSSNKYTADVANIVALFEKVEQRLTAVNDLENRAQEQIKKLDAIIEEKKINYNLRELQKTLDTYNNNVQRVSDFINKDVAEVLAENNQKIANIKQENESIAKQLEEEKGGIESLSISFRETNRLLAKMVEGEDVNEAYIYDILDRWAADRKVKIKK